LHFFTLTINGGVGSNYPNTVNFSLSENYLLARKFFLEKAATGREFSALISENRAGLSRTKLHMSAF